MEICIIRKQERVDVLLGHGGEGSNKIVHSAGSHNMNLQSEREPGLLHVFDMGLGHPRKSSSQACRLRWPWAAAHVAAARAEAVSARALEIGAMNYRSVASILANNLDRAAARQNRNEPTLFEHPNVRGP